MKSPLQTLSARVILPIVLTACAAVFSCTSEKTAVPVDLEKREAFPQHAGEVERGSIRIAVGSMITPREGYSFYKRLLDYMGTKIGKSVRFVDRENYAEINELLENGGLDAAFVCSGPYVDGHEKFGLELLVVPQAYGKPEYYSYVIVPRESTAARLEDLRGRTFAFTDPESNTGKLVPTYELARLHETPDSFFSDYSFTYAHDRSIMAVADGLVDGAAVDSLIWDYMNATNPDVTNKTRVIWKSRPFGIPPFVVSPGLDSETKERMKKVLLSVHQDIQGREILNGMMIERFVPPDDRMYDSIREMKSLLEGGREGGSTKGA